MTGIERVGSIADVGVEDIALVGNKAATFVALRRAGFPVPEAVV
jgi:phosphoenolpyruvate synthase/pyruvate phosphate dikinase